MKKLAAAAALLLGAIPSGAAYADTYRVDRAEAFYSCSNESDAMTILTSSYLLPYWDAVGVIDGYMKSTCPLYSINNGTIEADTLMTELIEPPGIYDRWAVIKWFDTAGNVYYTPVMRSAVDGLWYDSISTVMDVRAINGVIDMFK